MKIRTIQILTFGLRILVKISRGLLLVGRYVLYTPMQLLMSYQYPLAQSTNQTSLPNPKAAPSWEDVRDAIKPLITFFRQEAAEFNAAFKQTYEQPLSFTIGQLTYASVILIRSRQ